MCYLSSMRIFPLALGALLFAVPAKADKFWLSDPAASKAAAGSLPDVLEGVLIGEDADVYHVRIVGGEIQLSKKAVFKVEKDGLTLEKILEIEKQGAAKLAASRGERKAAPAASRRRRDVTAAEASAQQPGSDSPVQAPVFDPTVGRALPVVSDAQLQRDLHAAWKATRDRDFLVALRQQRRAQ
jgi:hypothetical protein